MIVKIDGLVGPTGYVDEPNPFIVADEHIVGMDFGLLHESLRAANVKVSIPRRWTTRFIGADLRGIETR